MSELESAAPPASPPSTGEGAAAADGATRALLPARATGRQDQALRDAERQRAQLEAVYDAITDGVMVLDGAGGVVFANEAMARFGGYASDSELRETALPREGPARFELWTAAGERLAPDAWPMARVLRGEALRDVELEVRRRDDGERRWYSYNAQPVRDGAGAQFLSVIVARDVTAQKASEDALRDGAERARSRAAALERAVEELRVVLDTVPAAVWISRDPRGDRIDANRLGAELLALPRGVNTSVTAPEGERPTNFRPMRDGVEIPEHELPIQSAARTGRESRDVEIDIAFDDGTVRHLLGNATPLRGDDGRPRGSVGAFIDITARKRAEAELAVVTRLYAVLSRVNEAIVRTRDEAALLAEVCRIGADDGGFPLVWVGLVRDGALVRAAAAGPEVGYLGEARIELAGELGRGPSGTAIREDRPVINDDFASNPATAPWRAAAARHGLRASAAFPLRRDGRAIGVVTFYAAAASAFTPKQVGLLEALSADVSYALDALEAERLRTEAEQALRQSEQSLREADRRKDEFLTMLSHELRNPLAPIRNSVFVLKHAPPGSDEAVRARTVIERQADHLTRLVDDLLDVTRVARGKIQLRRSRIDLRDVVLRAADDFRVVMDERGIAFRIEVPPAKAWVEADPTRITQVVGNLLHNAAKFSRRGDTVSLSLDAGGRAGEVRVRDTGAGIDRALLPQIFEPFVQGERTLARSEGGLGLGLALVKGIVEMHGGTVEAASAGPGLGAEFTVRLPLALEPELATARAERRAAAPRRVLVVDDNADAADTLADLLRIAGHEVEVAFEGAAALERARRAPPDVVLCDIGLPGMSGYDVARAFRADPALRGARLIALSGYAQAEDRQRAQEAGFDAHVAKPPDVEELVAAVGVR